MTLILAFGLVFQLPVVTTLLVRVGLLQVDTLVSKRRWAIVIAFVAAAVLTPPDPVSQIGLALPTILLYEASIFIGRMIEKKRAAEQAARDAELEGEAPAKAGESPEAGESKESEGTPAS
jgi:sec-independent protein translocase protein TatC